MDNKHRRVHRRNSWDYFYFKMCWNILLICSVILIMDSTVLILKVDAIPILTTAAASHVTSSVSENNITRTNQASNSQKLFSNTTNTNIIFNTMDSSNAETSSRLNKINTPTVLYESQTFEAIKNIETTQSTTSENGTTQNIQNTPTQEIMTPYTSVFDSAHDLSSSLEPETDVVNQESSNEHEQSAVSARDSNIDILSTQTVTTPPGYNAITQENPVSSDLIITSTSNIKGIAAQTVMSLTESVTSTDPALPDNATHSTDMNMDELYSLTTISDKTVPSHNDPTTGDDFILESSTSPTTEDIDQYITSQQLSSLYTTQQSDATIEIATAEIKTTGDTLYTGYETADTEASDGITTKTTEIDVVIESTLSPATDVSTTRVTSPVTSNISNHGTTVEISTTEIQPYTTTTMTNTDMTHESSSMTTSVFTYQTSTSDTPTTKTTLQTLTSEKVMPDIVSVAITKSIASTTTGLQMETTQSIDKVSQTQSTALATSTITHLRTRPGSEHTTQGPTIASVQIINSTADTTTEFIPTNSTNTGVSGATIGIVAGSIVGFWLILGPIICLLCRLRDKAKERRLRYHRKDSRISNFEDIIMAEITRTQNRRLENGHHEIKFEPEEAERLNGHSTVPVSEL